MLFRVTRRWIMIVILFAVLFLSGCGASLPGRLVVNDQTGNLDQARIAGAAAPLLQRGAVVAVFLVERGDDRGDDFTRRLAGESLQRGGRIAPDVLALYVSFDPRYSELRAGERWSGALPDATLRAIRLETLNPALQAGLPTAGIAATLERMEVELAMPGWQRLPSGWGWWLVAGMLALVVIALRDHPVLFRLQTALGATPPGKFASWLWAQTPIARQRARRRLADDMRRLRYDTDAAARELGYALDSLRRAGGSASLLPLAEAAHAALAERHALLENAAPTSDAVRDLRALLGEYRTLIAPLRAYARLYRAASPARVDVAAAGTLPDGAWGRSLEERLAALDARMEAIERRGVFDDALTALAEQLATEYLALSELARAVLAASRHAAAAHERFDKALAAGRLGKRDAKKHLSLVQRMEALDARRAKLMSQPDVYGVADLKELAAGYELLDREVWKMLDPREYQAAMRRAAATFLSSGSDNTSDTTTSSTPTPSDNTIPPLNYGDLHSGSSGPSSDGGAW